jgi:hypothetical protein
MIGGLHRHRRRAPSARRSCRINGARNLDEDVEDALRYIGSISSFLRPALPTISITRGSSNCWSTREEP